MFCLFGIDDYPTTPSAHLFLALFRPLALPYISLYHYILPNLGRPSCHRDESRWSKHRGWINALDRPTDFARARVELVMDYPMWLMPAEDGLIEKYSQSIHEWDCLPTSEMGHLGCVFGSSSSPVPFMDGSGMFWISGSSRHLPRRLGRSSASSEGRS